MCVCGNEHVHKEQKLLHTATRFLNITSEERKPVTSNSYLLLLYSYADH